MEVQDVQAFTLIGVFLKVALVKQLFELVRVHAVEVQDVQAFTLIEGGIEGGREKEGGEKEEDQQENNKT